MLDPCGPEMMAVFWAGLRGLLCGLSTGVMLTFLFAYWRTLFGEHWVLTRPTTGVWLIVVTGVVSGLSVVIEILRQFAGR